MMSGLLVLAAQLPPADFPVVFTLVEPTANTFFLNTGWLDPSRSEGIVGADLNPSSLASMKGRGDLYISGSLSGRSTTGLTFDLPILVGGSDSLEVGAIPVHLNASFVDAGGLDVVGIGGKLGPVAAGVIYQRASRFQVEVPGTLVPAELSSDSLFNFTYDYIAASGDTVPLDIKVSGDATGQGFIQANSYLQVQPLFAGAALGNEKLGAGLGVKYRKYSGLITGTGRFELQSANFAGTPSSPTYDVGGVNVELNVPPDSNLFFANYGGKIAAQQFGVVGGVSVYPAPFFGFSLAGEYGLRSTVTWDFTRTILLPAGAGVVLDSEVVNIDTLNQTMNGTLYMSIDSITKQNFPQDDDSTYVLASYTAIRGGIRLFILNLGGGAEFSLDNEGVYVITNYFAPHLSFPVSMFEFNIGAVASWRTMRIGFQSDGEPLIIPSIPTVIGGAGLAVKPDAELGKLFTLQEVALGARFNPMALSLKYIANAIFPQREGQLDEGGYFPNFALSAGVRIGLR